MSEIEYSSEGQYWHGTYKGVGFKVQSWHRKGSTNQTWNYYLYISLDKLKPDNAKSLWLRGRVHKHSYGKKYYQEYKNEILQKLDFHGGMTWYGKSYSVHDKKIVEVGCDYNHLMDEGREYDLRDIEYDLKHSVDTLLKALPELATPPKPINQPSKKGA